MATPDTEILRASIPAAQLAELEAITGQKASKWLRANMGEIIALARGERQQLETTEIITATRELLQIVQAERQQITGAADTIAQLKNNLSDFSVSMLEVSRSINDERARFVHVMEFLKGLHTSYQMQQENIADNQNMLPTIIDLLQGINDRLAMLDGGIEL